MPKTALVVDDSVTVRQALAFTLGQAGFTVLQASNGAQALQQVNGKPMALVITDLNMPEMDGLALIRALRGRPECKYVPILMLTTESQEAKKKEGKAAGATGWIVKPFRPEQLVAVVKKVLG